jgi:arylsulfatase
MLFPGMGRVPEAAVVNMKNVSFSITAEVTVSDHIAEGVIVAQGGRFGGWSLYAKDGKANFVYNYFGLESYRTQAEQPLPAGTHQVRAEFAYDGGGLGKGGNITLYYDGQDVGRGRIPHTQPLAFSAEETTDVGYESGSLVTAIIHMTDIHNKIGWVQMMLVNNFSHLIKPEERLRVVMTRR